jgi:hypothetical protein
MNSASSRWFPAIFRSILVSRGGQDSHSGPSTSGTPLRSIRNCRRYYPSTPCKIQAPNAQFVIAATPWSTSERRGNRRGLPVPGGALRRAAQARSGRRDSADPIRTRRVIYENRSHFRIPASNARNSHNYGRRMRGRKRFTCPVAWGKVTPGLRIVPRDESGRLGSGTLRNLQPPLPRPRSTALASIYFRARAPGSTVKTCLTAEPAARLRPRVPGRRRTPPGTPNRPAGLCPARAGWA